MTCSYISKTASDDEIDIENVTRRGRPRAHTLEYELFIIRFWTQAEGIICEIVSNATSAFMEGMPLIMSFDHP